MASSSSPSPIQQRGSLYDVFLSFSGIDTRKTFTSHLLAALNQQGFSTFHDETKLVRGEDISFQLPKAISESRVSIVVFSKSYAASGWCLNELVKIMECKRDFNQIVLPIFYDVDPSDVRYQRGFYAQEFKKHEDRFKGTSSVERVRRWRQALTKAANLSGWHLQNVFDRDEANCIKIVVNEVINRLDQLYCDVADHPVGIDSRVQELKIMLNLESSDVSIIAIWGIGGIGKTTIAKAVFNSICNKFEGASFLADVSETTKTSSGVVTLQKQLLSNILQNDTRSLDNYHQGIELIKKKLCHRRLLLVLDDVDHVQQLKMLAINRDLLCAGSKIIITTRNMSSLTSIQVDSIYSPPKLNYIESLTLFSWNAFKTDLPEEGFSDLSQEVVDYAEGLPLVLEVLGSFFSGRSKVEWESGLRKLRQHPHDDIQGKLRISFDLLDKKDQDLFLDIAFFFIGIDKDFAVKVLEDSECFPEIGIGELARRCLIQVDWLNKLWMHNLLREMAREIVYQEFSKEPSKRSRLRGDEEVLLVLRDSIGRDAIEGLYLELPESNKEEINVVAFADMRNLRLLHLNYLCHLSGTNLTASRKLKWLCWHGFPLAYIPDDLYMENLVAIDLQYSRLKQIWKGPKRLDKLRFLNLSYSSILVKTPDFSGLKNLEELLLHDCTNLVEVHYSIGCLDKLTVLNMSNCRSVRKFPSSILKLTSLRCLDLSGCSLLLEQGESRRLVSMLQRPLPNYQGCVPLSALSLQGLSCLQHLQSLDLSWCNLSNVPSEIGDLTSLKKLDLSGNKFSSIPFTLSNLPHLNNLYLSNCDKLKHLPLLPNSLEILWADNCLSLESESVGTQWFSTNYLSFENCPRLDVNKIERNIIRSFRDDSQASLFINCGELPLDLDFYGNNGSRTMSFVVPPDMGRKIRGWILLALFSATGYDIVGHNVIKITKGTKAHDRHFESTKNFIFGESHEEIVWVSSERDIDAVWYEVIKIAKGTKAHDRHFKSHEEFVWVSPLGKNQEEFVWVSSVGLSEFGFNLEGGDKMEFVFSSYQPQDITVKKLGIRLIYEGDEKAPQLTE